MRKLPTYMAFAALVVGAVNTAFSMEALSPEAVEMEVLIFGEPRDD